MLCIGKFPVAKKFMDKRWGEGVSQFSVENFLSHSAEKIRRATLQCVTNFGYRKILCFRELCHAFVSKFLCLSAENFRRNPLVFHEFRVSKFLGINRKNFWQGSDSNLEPTA